MLRRLLNTAPCVYISRTLISISHLRKHVSFTSGLMSTQLSMDFFFWYLSFAQEMTRMDANCEEFRSLRMAYQVAQRLVCLKYSNQGDDYIREELRKLKEGYAAGQLT